MEPVCTPVFCAITTRLERYALLTELQTAQQAVGTLEAQLEAAVLKGVHASVDLITLRVTAASELACAKRRALQFKAERDEARQVVEEAIAELEALKWKGPSAGTGVKRRASASESQGESGKSAKKAKTEVLLTGIKRKMSSAAIELGKERKKLKMESMLAGSKRRSFPTGESEKSAKRCKINTFLAGLKRSLSINVDESGSAAKKLKVASAFAEKKRRISSDGSPGDCEVERKKFKLEILLTGLKRSASSSSVDELAARAKKMKI